jgi:hypothetical protein
VNLVTGLQRNAAVTAMNWLAQSVTHNPHAGVGPYGARLVPAIIVEPIFAGLPVNHDMRVFARHATIDVGVFSEGQIVPARRTFGSKDINGAADVCSRFPQK